MNLLDEQVREDQRRLLDQWRIRFRQIGKEVVPSGTQDPDIIPWLHSLKTPTLFTHDHGFFNARWCHPGYCLVYLDVSDIEAAVIIRRFLRHTRFNTHAKRMGVVARACHACIQFWQWKQAALQRVEWPED